MKLLIVGGGGREHALAWKLCRDDPNLDIIAAPGNPGIAALGRTVNIAADAIKELATFAEDEQVDLTIVGPEIPLEAGIVNLFQTRGLPVFGPTREAARIETSKRFAKDLMVKAGIPTARATQHSDAKEAKQSLADFGTPVVIKASGLAAGKGVIVAQSTREAERAIDAMLSDRKFGNAGREILIEEYMEGEELSVFAITDGQQALPLLAAQDHKRLLEKDQGPNTGGMGAYAPTSVATPELMTRVMTTVIRPALAGMREKGYPFKGLLYAGLMLTSSGPKVVEFNCRFGDPETQAILPLMDSSLLELMTEVGTGGSLSRAKYPRWKSQSSVTTVVAAAGYPDKTRTGDPIVLPPPEKDVEVFHAGTAIDPKTSELVTAGGRVFAVTAVASTLIEATEMSRSHAEEISFAGKVMRHDIAWRELTRGARIT